MTDRHTITQSRQSNRVVTLTEDQIAAIVSRGVTEALTRLGVDVEHPLEMQRDFQHLREWRTAVSTAKSRGGLAIITVLVSGTLAALWVGLKILVKQ